VLLVEDDESNAHLISAYLKPFCRVEHVPDGESAVNLCRTEKFDAVLMDINLKGINGIDAHEQIRRINDHYNTIPVIAVTALAMSGDKEKFLSLGFTQYLSKPFERSHLLSLLSSAVSKQIRR
jgi:CheY-like chemotaxis protein